MYDRKESRSVLVPMQHGPLFKNPSRYTVGLIKIRLMARTAPSSFGAPASSNLQYSPISTNLAPTERARSRMSKPASKPAGAGAELTEDELLDQAIAANKAAADAGVRPLTRTELIAKLDQVMLLHVAAYADTYVPGPLYCTYGLRVAASCVLYAPEAQGSCCATVRTPYAYQPRACRTYRVPWHPRPAQRRRTLT